MRVHSLDLRVLADRLAVCRLERHSTIPAWATEGDLFSITRTVDELSVVCPEASVPVGVKVENGWRAFRVVGSIEFSVVGVLASLAVVLAETGISLFAVSTFETDYILIKEHDLERAVEALTAYGHVVHDSYPRA